MVVETGVLVTLSPPASPAAFRWINMFHMLSLARRPLHHHLLLSHHSDRQKLCAVHTLSLDTKEDLSLDLSWGGRRRGED